MKALIVAVVGIGHRTGRHGQCPDDRGAARRRSREELRRFREFQPAPRLRGRAGRQGRVVGGRGRPGPGRCGRLGDEAVRGEEQARLCPVRRQQLHRCGKGMASAGAGARRRRARHRPAAARTVLVDARPAARDRPDRVEPRLHGGRNATEGAPQPWTGRFTALGYDLYRFDREWINDWPGDATALADAVAKARQLGYRRVLLAGQSAGAWVSLAALQRGGAVDGVISISAAHHGEVTKMQDPTRARSEWQHMIGR